MKFWVAIGICTLLFGCQRDEPETIDDVVLDIIKYDFSNSQPRHSDEISNLLLRVIKSKPRYEQLSGTDMNNLCKLLDAATSIEVKSDQHTVDNTEILRSILFERVAVENSAYILFQKCRKVLNLKRGNTQKRFDLEDV